MRVVSGTSRGTKLIPVPGDSTRPILDRVKTALFDKLRPQIIDTEWLDLFAGSGSVGIEALSQGAKHCVFTELATAAIKTIRENLAHCKMASNSEVRHTDAFLFLRKCTRDFDFIFIAPPQYKTLWTQALTTIAERPALLKAQGRIIVQIDPKEYEAIEMSSFVELDQRKYGSTLLVFYGAAER